MIWYIEDAGGDVVTGFAPGGVLFDWDSVGYAFESLDDAQKRLSLIPSDVRACHGLRVRQAQPEPPARTLPAPPPGEAPKASNPKDAVGVRKAGLSCVPAGVMLDVDPHGCHFEVWYAVGLALLEGARKYGRHNYRVAGVRASVYYDAARRHLDWFALGQDIDPPSGLHHITKAIAGLIVVEDSRRLGNWTDDRPPPSTVGAMRPEGPGVAGRLVLVRQLLARWWEGNGVELVEVLEELVELRQALLCGAIEDNRDPDPAALARMADLHEAAALIVDTVRPDDPEPAWTAIRVSETEEP